MQPRLDSLTHHRQDVLLALCSPATNTLDHQAAMADKIRDIVDIPQSFVKEGTQFMNRCTKPSRKGERAASRYAKLTMEPRWKDQPTHPSSPISNHTNRIHPDLQDGRHGIRRHGIHRLLCQAHPHPNQQYREFFQRRRRDQLPKIGDADICVSRSRSPLDSLSAAHKSSRLPDLTM